MTNEDAQTMVNLLCWRRGIPAPRVRLTRIGGGYYYAGRNRGRGLITASRACDTTNTLLHETAHHVMNMTAKKARVSKRSSYSDRRLYAKMNSRRRGEKRQPHGIAFTMVLEDLAELWYGFVEGYTWEREYKCVQAHHAR